MELDPNSEFLQKEKELDSKRQAITYHTHEPPAKRQRRELPEGATSIDYIEFLDAQLNEWEDVVTNPDAPHPSAWDVQRYLAHQEKLCGHLVQHVAAKGGTGRCSDDSRLVSINGIDCLNMRNDPQGLRPSLMLHLYIKHFRIDNQPFGHEYTRSNVELLKAIHRGKLPARLLDEKPCYYYNGCVVVEVRDYRGVPVPTADGAELPLPTSACGVVVSRVLLKPDYDVLIDDLAHMHGKTANGPRKLSINNMLEAEKLLVNSRHSLCLDPSPRVATVLGALHYNAHKFDAVLEAVSPLLPSHHDTAATAAAEPKLHKAVDAGEFAHRRVCRILLVWSFL